MQQVLIAIAARQDLLRKGISQTISSFSGFEVIYETNNGGALLSGINSGTTAPQICIIDTDPERPAASESIAVGLKNTFPHIKVLAFLPPQNKYMIQNLMRAGVNCLLPNDCCDTDLKNALNALTARETYYPDHILTHIRNTNEKKIEVSALEARFLKFCCSELTYKEIADRMNVTTRAIEAIREGLFKKFTVVSKTGLVLEALRKGVISM